MRFFRRSIACVLAGFALMTAAPRVEAAHPPQMPAQTHIYHVYYRLSSSSPWCFYGWTPNAGTAAYHVNVLRSQGYEALYS